MDLLDVLCESGQGLKVGVEGGEVLELVEGLGFVVRLVKGEDAVEDLVDHEVDVGAKGYVKNYILYFF